MEEETLIKTTAQVKVAQMKKKYRVVQGGTSASKTFSIIPLLIDYAIKNDRSEISIVAENFPHLRRGAYKDFQKIMKWVGLWNEDQMNKGSFKYIFNNGSYIEFFGADKGDKFRGARRHILFVNEANNVKWDAFYQLAIRTSRFIYIDYNPSSEFWAHREIIPRENTDFEILTYKDNEALSPSIVKEIELAREKAKTSTYWENWWRVYGEGKTGVAEGLILTDWEQVDRIPNEAKLLGYGMDFGFNDPSTLIAAYEYNGKYYYDEVIYENELTTRDLSQRMKEKKVDKNILIWADQAYPMAIKELQRLGWKIKDAKKGKDSIQSGLTKLMEERFYITKKSVNTIQELRNYCWETDRSGKSLEVPIDGWNHSIDSMRYFMTSRMNKKQGNYHYAKL